MHGTPSGTSANRIVFSIRPPAEEWRDETATRVRQKVEDETFMSYLVRAHGGDVSIGDEFEEFVSCGCGSPRDVLLRIEQVEGGSVLSEATDLAFISPTTDD